jgi:predicted ArsR family transcriptional regulator
MDFTNAAEDVLSQPTRARLFGLLSSLRRGASTDELAKELGLHPNGVRQHLETMSQAGLVVRDQEKVGRGRPRDIWAIDPNAKPGGAAPTGYSELSRWLIKAIDGGPVDPGRIEERGREIGAGLADSGGSIDPETRFFEALSAMGFQPSRNPGAENEMTYCLENCPYRDAALERQSVICALHKGITSGILSSIDPETKMTRFVIKDPVTAGCEIGVKGPMIRRSEGGGPEDPANPGPGGRGPGDTGPGGPDGRKRSTGPDKPSSGRPARRRPPES